jgi:hypothetical protein
MSIPETPYTTPSLIDRRIRLAGKIGRVLCTTLLLGGTLLLLWFLGAVATQPEAIVKLNLTPERQEQVAGFKREPAKLAEFLQRQPEELMTLAYHQAEANKYQALVDLPSKRGGTVAVAGLLGVLVLGFVWLLRQLFAAFADGQVITADNARTLRRLGITLLVVGGLGLNVGVIITGLLILILGWNLQQALALQAEQALVI